MTALYSRAFASLLQLWRFFLFVTVAMIALDVTSSRDVSVGGFLVGAIFAHEMHRHFLLGETPVILGKRPHGSRPTKTLGFFFVTVVLFVVPVALAIYSMFLLIGRGSSDSAALISIAVAALILFVSYWLFLMTFGTALPAAATGDRYGLTLTLRRARHSFRSIGWGLLGGPGLFGTVFAGISFLPLDVAEQLSDDAVTGGISALGILTDLVLQRGGLFTTTLAVIVLCDGYRWLAYIPELGVSAQGSDHAMSHHGCAPAVRDQLWETVPVRRPRW